MLRFLSKVRIEFNALDPRTASSSCMEFLAHCHGRKAKESNPNCQIQLERRTYDSPPKITVTFVNGVEESFEATYVTARQIRDLIMDKSQSLEIEQMFRDAGEKWPVLIPAKEMAMPSLGIKTKKVGDKQQW